ncbi:MAG: uridine diphosphate-N-acetylglucosamine-binding protein YvcK, partial [Acidimicrobiia bacterium]
MRVVALGGGHGLATTLRAVSRYADDVTAVVSVADDGGSSGRLREALDIPAPGDVRRALLALSRADATWQDVFSYRFGAGDLEGHSLGNLILAGLTQVTGSFESALRAAANLLDVQGTVLPATDGPVVIKAESERGEVEGQVAVERAGRISAVTLIPADVAPPSEVPAAIAAADQVVIGPGSLFTSVIAACLPDATRKAIATAKGTVVYVCNLRENPETVGFDVSSHVDALEGHGISPHVVLCDDAELRI